MMMGGHSERKQESTHVRRGTPLGSECNAGQCVRNMAATLGTPSTVTIHCCCHACAGCCWCEQPHLVLPEAWTHHIMHTKQGRPTGGCFQVRWGVQWWWWGVGHMTARKHTSTRTPALQLQSWPAMVLAWHESCSHPVIRPKAALRNLMMQPTARLSMQPQPFTGLLALPCNHRGPVRGPHPYHSQAGVCSMHCMIYGTYLSYMTSAY